MIYDGDCGFCRRWVARWQRLTGPQLDYAPAQSAEIAEKFPELSREQLDTAVHLVTSDGSVFSGAEAVFRSLASASRARWLLRFYERSTAFAGMAERAYSFVARHRRLFSKFS